jgi:hypothetical protein
MMISPINRNARAEWKRVELPSKAKAQAGEAYRGRTSKQRVLRSRHAPKAKPLFLPSSISLLLARHSNISPPPFYHPIQNSFAYRSGFFHPNQHATRKTLPRGIRPKRPNVVPEERSRIGRKQAIGIYAGKPNSERRERLRRAVESLESRRREGTGKVVFGSKSKVGIVGNECCAGID